MTDDLARYGRPSLPTLVSESKLRLSEIFRGLADRSKNSVSIEELRDAMGDRGFAMLLVVFAGLNLLPTPPGSTLILGIPLMLVSAQMMLGYQTAWLPRFLLDRSISADRFRQSIDYITPYLERLRKRGRARRAGDRRRMTGAQAAFSAS